MEAKAKIETAVVPVALEAMKVKEPVVVVEEAEKLAETMAMYQAEEEAVMVEDVQAEKAMRKMVVRRVERDWVQCAVAARA